MGGNGAIAPKLAQAVTRKEPGNVTDLSTEVRNVWVARENPTSVTCRLAPLMASLNHGESGVHVPPHAAEECGMDKCPIDGVWGEWGPWEECVDGKQVSIRTCEGPQFGGEDCQGPREREQNC